MNDFHKILYYHWYNKNVYITDRKYIQINHLVGAHWIKWNMEDVILFRKYILLLQWNIDDKINTLNRNELFNYENFVIIKLFFFKKLSFLF